MLREWLLLKSQIRNSILKLIVGLGNYPREYTNTRHNAGFLVVDEWLKKHNLELNKMTCDSNERQVKIQGVKTEQNQI